jgi:demethylmenaquinone methyltransferase/2-methoxy-6-polyprenyl-1,4-benzoquinol methylase
LQLPIESRGLDVGCGIGLQSMLLANAVGPAGHITGLDINPDFLEYGERLVAKAGLSNCITLREGDMHRLPFAEGSFDWVWSADCIGYPLAELEPLLNELQRVVRPGGRIMILAWTSQQILPGYPLLEARLNATNSSYIPYFTDQNPDHHFLRALHWFRKTGLEEVNAQSFVGDVQAPLGDGQRAALASLFEMLWGTPVEGVAIDDWLEYQRLCTPGSFDFILNLPGYYAFFTYTVFQGTVPRR